MLHVAQTIRFDPSAYASSRPARVLLVGYEDQDNLGLRYLMSALAAAGHEARMLEFSNDATRLIATARDFDPDVVGFSLIFQYMTGSYISVIDALRDSGYRGHVTMGGHYPSFSYGEVLDKAAGLDSIVRFEGESTLCALATAIVGGRDWTGLEGLACRKAGRAQANCLRAVVDDLDSLPRPDRSTIEYSDDPLETASVLGSRGCPWKCSFCSIRPFYEKQGGALRRLRDPEQVVEELEELYETEGVRLFLFQDDDFLATGKRARDWASAIAASVRRRGLAGRIAYKISCRSDEVRDDIIGDLVAGGLTHVYMGVESGDEHGLKLMEKLIVPETHLKAGRILRAHDLSYDFGFMLLDPDSTFDRIRINIDFLDKFIGDGWSVAPFCRMLPYAGTPIRDRLEREGRLRGTEFEPDYVFLDPKIDVFYEFMLRAFHRRNFTSNGLSHLFRAMLFEAWVKLGGVPVYTAAQKTRLRYLAAVCNGLAAYTLRRAIAIIEATPAADLSPDMPALRLLVESELKEELAIERELLTIYQASRLAQHTGLAGGFDRSWTYAAAQPALAAADC